MRTMMIAFAGHQFYVRSGAEGDEDIAALDAFRAELERLRKLDSPGEYVLGKADPAVQRAHLRDEFAAAALTGLITVNNVSSSAIAKAAYEVADAMLAERDKPSRP